MKNILFFIHNEYHVFVIISLIKEYYSDLSKYNVTVLHQINPNDNRFEFEIKWEELGVEVITIKASKLEINKDEIVPKLELILQKNYYKYISFLEGSPQSLQKFKSPEPCFNFSMFGYILSKFLSIFSFLSLGCFSKKVLTWIL